MHPKSFPVGIRVDPLPSRITDSSFFGTVKAVPSTLPNARAAIGSFQFAQKPKTRKDIYSQHEKDTL